MVSTEYLYITFTVDMVHNDNRYPFYIAICIISEIMILFSNTAISKKRVIIAFPENRSHNMPQLRKSTNPCRMCRIEILSL